jgi:hypothetical protein
MAWAIVRERIPGTVLGLQAHLGSPGNELERVVGVDKVTL